MKTTKEQAILKTFDLQYEDVEPEVIQVTVN
jgi:hypothetical protein